MRAEYYKKLDDDNPDREETGSEINSLCAENECY